MQDYTANENATKLDQPPVHAPGAGPMMVDIEEDTGPFSKVLQVVVHGIRVDVPNALCTSILPGVVNLKYTKR